MKYSILSFVSMICVGAANAENVTCTFKSSNGGTSAEVSEAITISHPTFRTSVVLRGGDQGEYSYNAYAYLSGYYYNPQPSFVLNLNIYEANDKSTELPRRVTVQKVFADLSQVEGDVTLTSENGEDYVLRCLVQ